SEPIAEAYHALYGVRPRVIHNTFPLPDRAPPTGSRAALPLKLYWFSQTIGAGRGLEDVVRAVGLAGLCCELHLRGRAAAGYADRLLAISAAAAPRLIIAFHDPVPPDDMIDSCRAYDIGLATEE